MFCYYDINTNQAMGFNTRSRRSEPYTDDARGEMQVEMRVALGKESSSCLVWFVFVLHAC